MKTCFLIVLFIFFLSACAGGDLDGGATHSPPPSGTPGAAAPPGSPQMPAGPRPSGKTNTPLHNFADEGLNIPPFNENARTLPPEAFVESGKEQRDPFADLYGLLAVSDTNATSSESADQQTSSAVILLENFQLSQLSLSGIVWSAGREKALFTDPSGQPTIVMKDDRLGRGGALVKEITHDRVILELPAQEGETPKMLEFSLARTSGPYQVQYEKLRADQRGIRVRTSMKPKSKEVGP